MSGITTTTPLLNNDLYANISLRINIGRPPPFFAIDGPESKLLDVDQPTSKSPNWISIFVPVGCIIGLMILFVTAYRRRLSNKPSLHANRNKHLNRCDIERGSNENEDPENHLCQIQIVQEGGKSKTNRRDNRDDQCVESLNGHIVTFSSPTPRTSSSENNNEAAEDQEDDQLVERPNSLKFLAASAAYQESTLPALERLPCTPDPDFILRRASVQHCVVSVPAESESKDKVPPLTQAPRRMKPRGLLERRGSNVALTISLRAGQDNNSSTSSNNALNKSPKPFAQLRKASSLLTVEDLHQKSCDTSSLQKEFWSIPINHPSEKTFNIPGHGTKNRHRILPNDHSRVKLPHNPGEDQLSAYINANYIRDCANLQTVNTGPDDENELSPVTRKEAGFIATQGPLTNTVDDFWRMIWQEKIASIIMLTKLKERKEKCVQYFPMNAGAEETYSKVSVRVLNVDKHEHFSVRTMEISCGSETRSLCHFWYTTWMDHETPEKTRGLLEMVQDVSMWNKSLHGPIVVHCSAGIGRTGCFIAIYVGCQQLMKSGKTDVLQIVSQMRMDRGGMVQTWEQYQFVHQALSRYGRVLAGENVATPSTAGSIRSPRDCALKLPCAKDSESSRPRTPKHRRSTSDTNLPVPKELKVTLINSAVESRLQREISGKKDSSRPRTTSPCTPLSIASPKPLTSHLAESPSIRSPFNRMCLHTKDLNAGNSPLAAFKFKWPMIVSHDKAGATDVKESNNKNSPGRYHFSFTAVAVSSTPPNGTKPHPLSTTKSPSQSCFTFDLPSLPPKTPLTNGHVEDGHVMRLTNDPLSPRNRFSAKSASPHTASNHTHFVFPSPGTL